MTNSGKEMIPGTIGCGFIIFLIGGLFGAALQQSKNPEESSIEESITTFYITTENTEIKTTETPIITTAESETEPTTTYIFTTLAPKETITEHFLETITEAQTETQEAPSDGLVYLGSFTGTYYQGSSIPCYGGSGRMLVSCNVKDAEYKGSVASRLVYEDYGYNVNDKTMIYISFSPHPELNGWYSVDDCNSSRSIIDFYFSDYSTCPWQNDGLIKCEAWIGG